VRREAASQDWNSFLKAALSTDTKHDFTARKTRRIRRTTTSQCASKETVKKIANLPEKVAGNRSTHVVGAASDGRLSFNANNSRVTG
jgi:hypothetical protein